MGIRQRGLAAAARRHRALLQRAAPRAATRFQRLQDVEGAIAGATTADVPFWCFRIWSLEEWGELLLSSNPGRISEPPRTVPVDADIRSPDPADRGAHGTRLLAQSVGFVQWLVR